MATKCLNPLSSLTDKWTLTPLNYGYHGDVTNYVVSYILFGTSTTYVEELTGFLWSHVACSGDHSQGDKRKCIKIVQ